MLSARNKMAEFFVASSGYSLRRTRGVRLSRALRVASTSGILLRALKHKHVVVLSL